MKTILLAAAIAVALAVSAAEKSAGPLEEAVRLNNISAKEFHQFIEREFPEGLAHYK